jgi:hypothetical protein
MDHPTKKKFYSSRLKGVKDNELELIVDTASLVDYERNNVDLE